MEEQISALVDTYCASMNEICWYSNSVKWNRERLMDLNDNECGVKHKCPSVKICLPCENRKADFHRRLAAIERKYRHKSERTMKMPVHME
jgi:hypothetical protein